MLTEDEGFEMLRRIRAELGWAMLVMTRADAERSWRTEILDDDPDDPDPEQRMSDEQWRRIRDSREWSKGFESEPMMACAWSLVNGAVRSVMAAARDE